MHLLQLVSLNGRLLHHLNGDRLHFIMRPVHLHRHSCAPAPLHPLVLRPLPLLLRVPLPRLRLDVN